MTTILDWIGLDWIGLDWIGLDWFFGLSPRYLDAVINSTQTTGELLSLACMVSIQEEYRSGPAIYNCGGTF